MQFFPGEVLSGMAGCQENKYACKCLVCIHYVSDCVCISVRMRLCQHMHAHVCVCVCVCVCVIVYLSLLGVSRGRGKQSAVGCTDFCKQLPR